MKREPGAAEELGLPAAPRGARLRDFSQSLPMALLRAREAVMRQFRLGLRQYELTEQQWRVLRALTSVKEIGTTNLATTTFLLPPSLSRILRDLEARGLINRASAATDLRRGLVSISAKGTALVELVGRESELIYAEITWRFGAVRLAQLQSMLRELEKALGEPNGPVAERGIDPPAGG